MSGWREAIADVLHEAREVRPMTLGDQADAVMAKMREMPIPDRIALARELLAGTGRVPARELTAMDMPAVKAHIMARRAGDAP